MAVGEKSCTERCVAKYIQVRSELRSNCSLRPFAESLSGRAKPKLPCGLLLPLPLPFLFPLPFSHLRACVGPCQDRRVDAAATAARNVVHSQSSLYLFCLLLCPALSSLPLSRSTVSMCLCSLCTVCQRVSRLSFSTRCLSAWQVGAEAAESPQREHTERIVSFTQ